MVKKNLGFFVGLLLFFSQSLMASERVLDWEDFSSQEEWNIQLSNSSDEVTIVSKGPIEIVKNIECNGILRISSPSFPIHLRATLKAPHVILESLNILLANHSSILASALRSGGKVFIGGGWQGQDPSILSANRIQMEKGALICAEALTSGPGGMVVLWSELATDFQGQILAKGKGLQSPGGEVEVSSRNSLHFDGLVELSSEGGSQGHLLLDPVSITIQTANPDIYGNGTMVDMTNINDLNNATTTPTGFPNAPSVITAGALNALLLTGVSATLAAQNFITVNAAITTANNNVTLTLSAPTVNLNSPITFTGTGDLLQGSGVTTANVGALGLAQNGVDVVAVGGMVNLASAIYNAPINISKNLTLNGNGQANTTVKITGAVPAYSGRNPAIYVTAATNAIIQNLTVDGNNIGFPTNPSIVGIYFLDAGGAVLNTHVTQIANTPPPYGGGQQGNAIRAFTAGGPYSVNFSNNTIDFFQKSGIVINGNFLAIVSNNTITWPLNGTTPAPIGIQLNGGSGTISGNSLSHLAYPADYAQAAGIFITSNNGYVLVSGNSVDSSDGGITGQSLTGEVTIQNNTVTNSGDVGIDIENTNSTVHILSNTLIHNGGLSADVNASLFINNSSTQLFDVANNSITPTAGMAGQITQGAVTGAPNVQLNSNSYIDP
jgi:hypothetical protein